MQTDPRIVEKITRCTKWCSQSVNRSLHKVWQPHHESGRQNDSITKVCNVYRFDETTR